MKNFHNLITSLQKNITENNATALVAHSIFNQQILYSLQVNGYIDGFNILNPRQILVILR
jgi:ribosomal protein S8